MRTMDDAIRVVYGRSRGICEKCGAAPGQQYHHRQPRGMGGGKYANTPDNLLHLCESCHRWVESHRTDAYHHGWLVKHGIKHPADTVVKRRGLWCYLAANGTVHYINRNEKN